MRSKHISALVFIATASIAIEARADVTTNPIHGKAASTMLSVRRAADSAVLEKIKARAAATKSEELIILQVASNSQFPHVVFKTSQSTDGSAVRTVQSVAKTVAALTYLLLIRDGRVESLDVPLSKFYPEMANDERRDLTVRAVLTHSTGIIDPADLWDMKDLMAGILKIKPSYSVFTQFAYSNAAAELMGNILDRLTPPSRDPKIDRVIDFLNSKVLSQIGVGDLTWARDSDGHLATSGGIMTSRNSLSRLGLLLLQKGSAGGKVVIERSGSMCFRILLWASRRAMHS